MDQTTDINTSSPPSFQFRDNLKAAAKTFKSNWVQFGELLTKTATEKQYTQWGFKTFEEYCARELRIKKTTAIKLTNAYFFITKEDPQILEQAEIKGIPDLDVVNFLHRTKEKETCSPEIYEELKSSAIEKGQTGKTLARRFRELVNIDETEEEKNNLDQSLSLVNRLQRKIKPIGNLPPQFVEYLHEIEDFLHQAKSTTDPDEPGKP